VTYLRKLICSIWRSATVLEDVIDQGLLVMDVELGRDDVVEQRSEVAIRLRRVDLGHYTEISS